MYNSPRLIQQRLIHSATEYVQLRLTHHSSKAQEQAIVVVGGIVKSVLIGQQRPENPTEFDQLGPVLVGASQPTQFNAKNNSDLIESDLGQQAVIAMASFRSRGRMPLIFINDHNAIACPAQLDGEVGKSILTGRRFLVIEDLLRGRLADVDDCHTVPMMRLQFRGSPDAG
jgi:hypothetical protein